METVSRTRNAVKDIGTVVAILTAGTAITAAFAHYGMDAKEMGDYVAATFSVGPPVTVACGLVAAGLSQLKQYAHTGSKYLPH